MKGAVALIVLVLLGAQATQPATRPSTRPATSQPATQPQKPIAKLSVKQPTSVGKEPAVSVQVMSLKEKSRETREGSSIVTYFYEARVLVRSKSPSTISFEGGIFPKTLSSPSMGYYPGENVVAARFEELKPNTEIERTFLLAHDKPLNAEKLQKIMEFRILTLSVPQ